MFTCSRWWTLHLHLSKHCISYRHSPIRADTCTTRCVPSNVSFARRSAIDLITRVRLFNDDHRSTYCAVCKMWQDMFDEHKCWFLVVFLGWSKWKYSIDEDIERTARVKCSMSHSSMSRSMIEMRRCWHLRSNNVMNYLVWWHFVNHFI
jgi:hypothetical protein